MRTGKQKQMSYRKMKKEIIKGKLAYQLRKINEKETLLLIKEYNANKPI